MTAVATSALPRRTLGALRTRRVLLLAIACVVAWPPLAWAAALWLAAGAGRPEAGAGQSRPADALVVLAGSSSYSERARRAAALYAEGRGARVVLTNDDAIGGWSHAEQRNPFFAERAAEVLRRGGVPPDRIEIIWRPVASTYEEAVLAREYAAARNFRSIVVVTSAYHSRRALWTFRSVLRGSGIAVELDGHASGGPSPPPSTWWLHLRGWQMVAGEYVKFVYYWLFYV